jgi:hypothetical protein
MMNLKVFRRKHSWHNEGTSQAFAERNKGKPQENSVHEDDDLVEV